MLICSIPPHASYIFAKVDAKLKNFNAQTQIVQPKLLIGKTQAQISQEKIKIGEALIAQPF